MSMSANPDDDFESEYSRGFRAGWDECVRLTLAINKGMPIKKAELNELSEAAAITAGQSDDS